MLSKWGVSVLFLLIAVQAFTEKTKPIYDEKRLWLPLKYERYYLKLKQATQAAAELERCVKVLESTIDLEKTTTYTPFFKVLCRQPNGRTYVEIVDGTTFRTLTTVAPKNDPAQIEAARKKRIAALLNTCTDALNKKTALMKDVAYLFEEQVEPKILEEDKALFILDFNANNPQKIALKYRAYCNVEVDKHAKLKIKKRPSQKK